MMHECVQDISLDGEWAFSYQNADGKLPDEITFDAIMPVPGRWDDNLDPLRSKAFWNNAKFNPDYRAIKFPLGTTPPDASWPYLLGVGWYRKEVFIPQTWQNRQISLECGGASCEAEIWLNKTRIGGHSGFALPFTLALEENILYGQNNELIISVSNIHGKKWWGCGNRGYKGVSGGLYRSVQLHISAARIESLYAYPAGGRLNWQIEIKADRPVTLKWMLYDEVGDKIVAEDSFTVEPGSSRCQSDIPDVQMWSDTQPKCYVLQAYLQDGQRILDHRDYSIGFREITVQGRNILINGVPVYLRGSTEHAYFPQSCTPPIRKETYKINIRKLKSLGFNWLRFHTWIPPEEYLQAADETGMLVQLEPPTHFDDEEWNELVQVCRVHPSVIIFCCGNEELMDEAFLDRIANLAAYQKDYAPSALFNPQESLRGIDWGYVLDEYGSGLSMDGFPHNPERLERVKSFSDCLGQFAWGLLSYLSSYADPRWLDRRFQLHEKPILSHEVCIHGSYLNLDLGWRYEGTRIGPRLYEAAKEYMSEAGVLDLAPAYYLNSCKWMQMMRKHCLENARKCSTIAGYDLLSATDHHWHRTGYPCGVMNEFYELKPGEAEKDVLRYNGASVVLTELANRRSFVYDETVPVPVLISHYGREAMVDASVEWVLKNQYDVYQFGKSAIKQIKRGKLSDLGTITIKIPRLEQPCKLELHIRVSDHQQEVDNSWSIWAFPQTGHDSEKQYRVSESLDTDDLAYMQAGGTVLLLGTDPFPAERINFQIGIAGRPKGNLATILHEHALLDRFIHEGFCDWQFYDMIESGYAVVFDQLGFAFKPILEIASGFKSIHKQAALFEASVGSGKLFVCGLTMHEQDPAGQYLLHLIHEYLCSDRFVPQIAIAVSQIEFLLQINEKRQKRRLDAPNLFITEAERALLPEHCHNMPNLVVVNSQ